MLGDESYLHSNDNEVAAKVVDGEAILINLSNGLYYSMDKVGAHIWSMLASGSSVNHITASVCQAYSAAEAVVKPDVQRLVQELLDERLVVLGDGDPTAAPPVDSTGPAAYVPPRLVKYDDMADMFALDPPLPELPALSTDERS